MMDINLKELERLAEEATPRPWYPLSEMCEGEGCDVIISKKGEICDFLNNVHSPFKDRKYIVTACNSVPDLIAENRELREKVQDLERQREYLASELSTDDDQADCNHTHLSCEHRKGWLCKAGMKGQMQCWISEAEKAAKEAKV